MARPDRAHLRPARPGDRHQLDTLVGSLELELSGWGRYPVAACAVERPEKIAAAVAAVLDRGHSSVLARGGGRSYGDASLNPGGLTILMERLNRLLAFDSGTGLLHCEAGVTLDEIVRAFAPRGWFPQVTPGTKFVTLAGALAGDVHGKNHHRSGSFVSTVGRFRILTADGGVLSCSREENQDLFWATAGGMGLTGVVLDLEVQLRPLPSPAIDTLQFAADGLAGAMDVFERHEAAHEYSIAWIDCLAGGRGLGRAIVTLGDHHRGPVAVPAPRAGPRVPFDPPISPIRRTTVRLFNAAYFHAGQAGAGERVVALDQFFYPLDRIGGWNRVYGPGGFVQFQCVLPQAQAHDGISELIQLGNREGWRPFLTTLKRLGPQAGWLSFPMPGYTLAVDMPVNRACLELMDRFDEIITRRGGRINLSKDARMGRPCLEATYPELDRWRVLKRAADPNDRFASAMSRRLGLGARRA